MSPRKPNMLEAFQASAKADKARQAKAADATTAQTDGAGSTAGQSQPGQSQPGQSQPGQSQPGQSQPGQGTRGPVPSGAGGPFAGAPPTPSPAATPGDLILGTAPRATSGLRGMLSDEVLQKARLPLIGVGIVSAMLLMFFLGRKFGGGDETQAAAPGQATEIGDMQDVDLLGDSPVEVPNNQREQTADRAKTNSGLTAADRAFLDKSNRWSVRAIQFTSDARGSKLALSTYNYLVQKGLPAVAPITQGDILVICVGAEPSRNAKIEGIRAQLLSLTGPPPGNEPGAFDSAYFVNIEDQIDEKHRQ